MLLLIGPTDEATERMPNAGDKPCRLFCRVRDSVIAIVAIADANDVSSDLLPIVGRAFCEKRCHTTSPACTATAIHDADRESQQHAQLLLPDGQHEQME